MSGRADDAQRSSDRHRPSGRGGRATRLGSDTIIVNVQGDEPLIEPEVIMQTARQLAVSGADIATVAHPITTPPISSIRTWSRSFAGPMAMPPIFRGHRSPMRATTSPGKTAAKPCRPDFPAYRHVGLYAYRASFLKAYAGLTVAPTEHFESLEQLRALWHGYRISVT
jgi:3-deoxy-manno-octulosonate cytidylyltransferase (CMP-KDO synthetase)